MKEGKTEKHKALHGRMNIKWLQVLILAATVILHNKMEAVINNDITMCFNFVGMKMKATVTTYLPSEK